MTQLDHSRLVDEVGRSLEEKILAGELRPGDRLTVIPLAQHFGMSQSTIREALLMLEHRGLVQSNPRRGYCVTRLSMAEAVELCRMRALLEAYAVTVGLHNLTEETLAELRRHIDAMRRCTLPRALPALIQSDLALHRLIAELPQSPTLIEVWSTLSSRIGALIMRTLEAHQLGIADVVRLHTDLVDALATRDPELARPAVIEHYLPEDDSKRLHTEALHLAVQAMVQPSVQPVA